MRRAGPDAVLERVEHARGIVGMGEIVELGGERLLAGHAQERAPAIVDAEHPTLGTAGPAHLRVELDGVVEFLLRLGEPRLGIAAGSDVDRHPYPFEDPPVGPEDRHGADIAPRPAAVGATQPEFRVEIAARARGLVPQRISSARSSGWTASSQPWPRACSTVWPV